MVVVVGCLSMKCNPVWDISCIEQRTIHLIIHVYVHFIFLSSYKKSLVLSRGQYVYYKVTFHLFWSITLSPHKAQVFVYIILYSNHFHSMFASNTGTFVPVCDCALGDRVSSESETFNSTRSPPKGTERNDGSFHSSNLSKRSKYYKLHYIVIRMVTNYTLMFWIVCNLWI